MNKYRPGQRCQASTEILKDPAIPSTGHLNPVRHFDPPVPQNPRSHCNSYGVSVRTTCAEVGLVSYNNQLQTDVIHLTLRAFFPLPGWQSAGPSRLDYRAPHSR